ncbi:MAG: hypothetical protein RBG13Loki_0075 [Promethearchaeota archaeon CR_4]|nr:MAG: hypothetical protein RBG13Loki_0075 [Candidatus Lokiarchaeota archaeon CR_4]
MEGDSDQSSSKSKPPFFTKVKARVKGSLQKVERLIKPKKHNHENKEQLVAFRQLICAKIHRENRNEFISVLQALGFKDITTREFIGKRRSTLMFSKVLANGFRLHLRLYEVGQDYFILAHMEPLPSADVKFHVKGFVRWAKGTFRHKNEPPKEVGSNDELPDPSEKVEEFRMELADYEAGGDQLKALITTVPNFEKKVDFSITDEDLRLFNAIYGAIDHIPTITLILENFLESAGKNFEGGARSLPKILEILGFRVSPVLGESGGDSTYLARAIFTDANYTLLVGISSGVPSAEMDALSRLAPTLQVNFTLLVLPNEEFPGNIEANAKQSRVNVISASNLGIFFLDHGDYPFTQLEIQSLFSPDGGIISLSHINEIISKKKDFEQIFTQSRNILDILQQMGKWVPLKEVEKLVGVPDLISKETVTYVLNFLTNPLIGLVEEQKGKLFKAILNNEEIQLKLRKLEELLNNIRPRKTVL